MIVADGKPLGWIRDPPGQRSVYIPPGDTKREVYRLRTFEKYPPGLAVDPWTLAKAGFNPAWWCVQQISLEMTIWKPDKLS